MDNNNIGEHIELFQLSDDGNRIIMKLDDGTAKDYDCRNPFDIVRFYEVMDQIGNISDFHPVYTNSGAFVNHAQHELFRFRLKKVIASGQFRLDADEIENRLIARHLMKKAMQPGQIVPMIREIQKGIS